MKTSLICGSSTNTNQDKFKREPHLDKLYSDCQKIKRISKAAKQMWPIVYKRSSVRLTADFSSEDSRMAHIKCWKNKIVNHEFYIKQNYPSKMRDYDIPR